MMKTLYVTDLDGTLLNRNTSINQLSIHIINELVEKGMMFTYATARSPISSSKITKGLSINIPVITYNGAVIINRSTKEVLFSTIFSKQDREKVISVLEECDISPLVYSHIDNVEKVSWITSRENYGIKRYLNFHKGDKRFRPLKSKEGLYMGSIFYFTCIGEKEELMPVYEILSKDDKLRCTIQQELYGEEYWCEIMPKNVTKSDSIKKLKEILGCGKVVSFGDAINDIPMFQISDECYAVENAVDELKSIATGIIGSNEEDCVAKWLKENVGL